jgi:hypothetical protein
MQGLEGLRSNGRRLHRAAMRNMFQDAFTGWLEIEEAA